MRVLGGGSKDEGLGRGKAGRGGSPRGALRRRRALPRPFLVSPPEDPPQPAPERIDALLFLPCRPALFTRGLGGVAGLRRGAGLASVDGDLLGVEEALVAVAELRGHLIFLE